MIARLWGVIEEQSSESVILRAGDVGYRVLLSPYALSSLSGTSNPVALRTFLIWSEHQESPILVGFVEAGEEELFHEIRRIGGLGATKAIRMISLPPNTIWQAIAGGDVSRLKTLKGVGETTAKKLVSELKDRVPPAMVPAFVDPGPSGMRQGGADSQKIPVGLSGAVVEILTRQFGHPPAEVEQMIRRALSRNPAINSVEELFNEVYRHGVD